MTRISELTNFLCDVVETEPKTLRARVAAEAIDHDDILEFFAQVHAHEHPPVGSEVTLYCDLTVLHDAHRGEIAALIAETSQTMRYTAPTADAPTEETVWFAFREIAARLLDQFMNETPGDGSESGGGIIDPIKTPSSHPEATPERTRKIAELNDLLRGTFFPFLGRVVSTLGIRSLPEPLQQMAYTAVREFDAFTPDNDPHGEHDFGAATLADGTRVFWKIDYYDPTLSFHSDDPADPKKTVRVLTIMLAEEY